MAKFKVKVLQLLLKGNKTAKSGEEVDESQLLTNAKDLEKDKFIERVDTKSKKKAEEEAKKKAEEEEAKKKAAFNSAYEAGKLNESQLDSMNMEDIYTYAEKHKIEIDKSAKKADLIQTVLKTKK